MTLVALWFTLYPLVGIVYLYYLLPMIALPYLLLVDHFLQRYFRTSARVVAVIASVIFISLAYLGSRYLAGDWQHQGVFAKDIAPLDFERGEGYYPARTVVALQPVLKYLDARPGHESFVLLDRMNEAVAFLSRKKAAVDYALEYYSGRGYGPEDFAEIQTAIVQQRTATVIVAKEYLSGSPEELEFTDFLSKDYRKAIDTPSYTVYARQSAR